MWYNLTARYQYTRRLGGVTLRLTDHPTLTCYFQLGDDCAEIERLIASDLDASAIDNSLDQYTLEDQFLEVG